MHDLVEVETELPRKRRREARLPRPGLAVEQDVDPATVPLRADQPLQQLAVAPQLRTVEVPGQDVLALRLSVEAPLQRLVVLPGEVVLDAATDVEVAVEEIVLPEPRLVVAELAHLGDRAVDAHREEVQPVVLQVVVRAASGERIIRERRVALHEGVPERRDLEVRELEKPLQLAEALLQRIIRRRLHAPRREFVGDLDEKLPACLAVLLRIPKLLKRVDGIVMSVEHRGGPVLAAVVRTPPRLIARPRHAALHERFAPEPVVYPLLYPALVEHAHDGLEVFRVADLPLEVPEAVPEELAHKLLRVRVFVCSVECCH